MKNAFSSVCFMFLIVSSCLCQKVSFPLKFFTLRHARLSVGLGIEGAFDTPGKGKSYLYHYLGNTGNLSLSHDDSIAYSAYKLVVDFYSPNSVLSFSSGVNYATTNFRVTSKNNLDITEKFDITTIDIPAYIKLMFGSREKRDHYFINLGGIYSIPSNVKRTYTELNSSTQSVDRNKSQLKSSNLLGSSVIGADFYLGRRSKYEVSDKNRMDRMRLVLFVKLDLRLNNLIDPDYLGYYTDSTVDYSDFEFKEFRLSFGLSYNFTF